MSFRHRKPPVTGQPGDALLTDDAPSSRPGWQAVPLADDDVVDDERGVYSKDPSIPSYNSYASSSGGGGELPRGTRRSHAEEVRQDAKEARASKVVCAVLFALALVVRLWGIGYPDQVV